MKILFQIEGAGIGGNEVLLFRLFRFLMLRGVEIFLTCPEGAAKEFLSGRVTTVLNSCCDASEFRTQILQNNVDLVVAVHGPILEVARAARSANVPSLWLYGHPYWLSGWGNDEVQLASALFDLVIAQSKFLASALPPNSTKVVVVPNGVELESFRPLSPEEKLENRVRMGIHKEAFVIGYPARKVPYKRHDVLEKTLCLLSERFKNLMLIFLGAHSEFESAALKSFTVAPEKVRETLGVCDLAIFPAEEEGYGCAVAESLALGLPSLICRHGGHKEFLGVGEEFFYGENDPVVLAERVSTFLANRELRNTMGLKARTFSETLDSKRYNESYLQIFDRMRKVKNESSRQRYYSGV